MDTSQVANAKAMMGAAFIQYVFYAFVYVMEGSKYGELHPIPVEPEANDARPSENRRVEEHKSGIEGEA